MNQLLSIPGEYITTGIILIASTIISILILRLFPSSLPGAPDKAVRAGVASRLLDRILTGLVIFLLLWKLSPLLTSFSTILQAPIGLLYLPGGLVGTLLGIVGVGIWLGWILTHPRSEEARENRPLDLRALLIFAAALLLIGIPTGRIRELASQGLFSSAELGTGSQPGNEAFDFSLPTLEDFSAQAHSGEPAIITAVPADPQDSAEAPREDLQQDIIQPLGGQILLSNLRGKPVVLNFWATWCPPCRAEFPELVQLQQDYGADVHIIGVNLTSSEGRVGDVQDFVDQYEPRFIHVLDTSGAVQARYGVRSVPTTIIIDQTGIITYRRGGAVSANLLAGKLDRLLSQESLTLPAP
jgi:thiol-disulfide isomerase/thioredoxin